MSSSWKFVHLLAAFWLAACGSVASALAAMKTSDYFDSGPQRELAAAAGKGQTDAIDRLLDAGASVNFQGKEGMTALIWAIIHQSKKGYQHVLERGANPNLQMTRSTLTRDGLTDGNSAMSFAAMHEDPWYLEVTLKHGGDPNIVNPLKEVTPIFQCIMLLDHSRPRPRLEQLKMLIAAGANLNTRNRDGFTPMMIAAMANRYDMVFMMLEAGADPTSKIRSGATIVSTIKLIRTDPKGELYQWRGKVIDLLKAKGIDVEKGK